MQVPRFSGINRRSVLHALGSAGLVLTGARLHAAEPAGPTMAVAFVADFEPFVMGQDRGILVELVREASRRLGRTLRKLDFPSLRLDQDPLGEFPTLDMFVGTPATRRPEYFYTPVYAFDNVAASLTERALRVATVHDLAGKSVVAFPNASMHLKEPFTTFHRQVLASSKAYLETERMESIVAMLLSQRAQVVMLDRTFLRFYARKLGRPNLQGITVHELFPERNIIYAVSKQQHVIAQVRKHLDDMERSGWTATMLKAYL